jgi:hypothetical protein
MNWHHYDRSLAHQQLLHLGKSHSGWLRLTFFLNTQGEKV